MGNRGESGEINAASSTFEKDIDELLDEFEQCGSRSFSAFKKVWLSRKFSYIYEARPAMQCLYSHCIENITKTGALSRRLGGLYCLYCLHEVQPFRPSFKIYISLRELKLLRKLVVDSKKEGTEEVPALVNRMIERQYFLFGSVDAVHRNSLKQRVDDMKNLQKRLLETAYDKLLACSQIEDYMNMNLGQELDFDKLKQMSSDYVKAKELAVAEASKMVEVHGIRMFAERGDEVGAKMAELVEEWDAGRQEFLRTTGRDQTEKAADDEFTTELEQLLSED